MAGILGRVSAGSTTALADALATFTDAPERSAIFCDIDGTLAPIVRNAEDARVAPETARLLGVLARRYACVACISGRPAAEAKRLVGVGSIAYVGMHGAERFDPGEPRARLSAEVAAWREPVQAFARSALEGSRLLRIRVEDKGPIVAFHWRGVPDEPAARRRLDEVAEAAQAEGLRVHWARKVLEIRPPVDINKGLALRELVAGSGVRHALFSGDDATDLDAFDAIEQLAREGLIDSGLKIGVRSEEGPRAIVEQADFAVSGVPGFVELLALLA